MPEQTFLAFDVGLKKIGVALGNSLIKQAKPLTIIKSEVKLVRFQKVADLLTEWQPDLAIVGLPLTLDDQEQPASRQARRFAHQLKSRFNLDVILVDERGSSLEAQSLLGNNNEDDAMAAAVILQRYFDRL